jgi:hypothetical protein
MRINTPRNVRVIITKPPPAPLMDGFDVGSYRKGVLYDVEYRLGRYLMEAGYAVSALRPSLHTPYVSAAQEHQLRRAEDRIRDEWHDSRAKTIGPMTRRPARPR